MKNFVNSRVQVVVGAALSLFVMYCIFSPRDTVKWTGFKEHTEVSRTEEIVRDGKKATIVTKKISGKTLWDWLNLLIAPASLLAFGAWLQARQEEEKRKGENVDREKAEDKQQEEALIAYLESISRLLIDNKLNLFLEKRLQGLLTEDEKYSLNAGINIIRARTISILRRLSIEELEEDDKPTYGKLITKAGKRKGQVLLFLYENKLVSKQVKSEEEDMLLNLKNFDFSNMDIQGEDLSGADLRNGFFTNADFSNSNLCSADLSYTFFINAKLNQADLSNADLRYAHLFGTDLTETKFNNAHLGNTVLYEANLTDADLIAAKHWTTAQIGEAKLCRTKLPKGCSLEPNRDCEELTEERWKRWGFSDRQIHAFKSQISKSNLS